MGAGADCGDGGRRDVGWRRVGGGGKKKKAKEKGREGEGERRGEPLKRRVGGGQKLKMGKKRRYHVAGVSWQRYLGCLGPLPVFCTVTCPGAVHRCCTSALVVAVKLQQWWEQAPRVQLQGNASTTDGGEP